MFHFPSHMKEQLGIAVYALEKMLYPLGNVLDLSSYEAADLSRLTVRPADGSFIAF